MPSASKNQMLLAIDEAGFAGYSDKNETFPGQYGIAAGALFPMQVADEIERAAKKAAFRVKPGRKLHMTDLETVEHERLRDFVSDLAEAHDIQIFYCATSVAGLYRDQLERDKLAARAMAARRSTVKLSGSNNPDLERHLEHVYRNTILDAVAYCNDQWRDDYHLTVRSDMTDATLLGSLEAAVTTLCKTSHTKVTRQTGFDPITKSRKVGSVSVSWDLPESMAIHCDKKHLTVDLKPLPLETALIPDAIVNWMNYCLKARVKADPNTRLNEKAALRDFPLSDRIYRFSHATVPHFVDDFYARPADPAPPPP